MTAARCLLISTAVSAAIVALAAPARAGAPTDQLRSGIERVIRVLEDPAMKQPARTAERRARIRAIASDMFDFRETSQRSLARHWAGRTPAERDEFVRLFTDLLERSYVGKIELYSGERILYLGEAIEGEQATVRTRLVTKQGTEIPVDYRMHRRGERWLAYDVSIEGVSLVANYRAQFHRIIQTASYAGLVDKLRAKQDEGQQADAGMRRAQK